MRTFSITDVGMVRQVNQDYVYVTDRPLGILQNLCGGRRYGRSPGGRLCFQVYG